MKPKKYSESKIKTANKFLSKYNLSFEDLNEEQKRFTIKYTYSTKGLVFYLSILLLGVLIFSLQGFIASESINYFIGKGTDLANYELESDGKICFALGFISCFFYFIASLLLLYGILLPILKKNKLKSLDAFLPDLRLTPINDKETSSQ